MNISNQLHIEGKKVLVVGFWWYQNMGDELILLGTLKLLLAQGKEIFVVSANNERLKTFFSQPCFSWEQGKFIDISHITFVDELPRGFRSLRTYIIKKKRKQLKYFFQVDAVILGGWEILTEESPHSYRYRLQSIRPAFLWRRKLYIMGGVQIPRMFWNKILFRLILGATKKIFSRDFNEIEHLQHYGFKNTEFFMDTSYFAIDDRGKYKKEAKLNYIVVNINRHGRLFMEDFIEDVKKYLHMGYTVYFVPVCAGWTDDDKIYFDTVRDLVDNKPWLKQGTAPAVLFELYDRRKDFKEFLKLLWGAKKVISARLHLFLISEFMWLETKAYPYQKKVSKMQETLEQIEF